jgi:hypothetical protein
LKRLLTERYRERLAGVLSCYDRIIVIGTLPGACYAKGMTAFLSARQIRTFLRPATGKCLHYYFYFIDAELGLIYLRVPTWCPFRLQFYCNGHSWLARQLTAPLEAER